MKASLHFFFFSKILRNFSSSVIEFLLTIRFEDINRSITWINCCVTVLSLNLGTKDSNKCVWGKHDIIKYPFIYFLMGLLSLLLFPVSGPYSQIKLKESVFMQSRWSMTQPSFYLLQWIYIFIHPPKVSWEMMFLKHLKYMDGTMDTPQL